MSKANPENHRLEPMHGWAIAQRIRQMSDDALQVGRSALNPALHRQPLRAFPAMTVISRRPRAIESRRM